MTCRLRFPLFKATYEWLLDQNLTPYFLINATFPKVVVPQQFIEDGQIILDASPDAIDQMIFDKAGVSFTAEFDTLEFKIYFPIEAILALYAEENDQGLFATEQPSTLIVHEEESPLIPNDQSKKNQPKPNRNNLKLIK